jgi:hypothetical protein
VAVDATGPRPGVPCLQDETAADGQPQQEAQAAIRIGIAGDEKPHGVESTHESHSRDLGIVGDPERAIYSQRRGPEARDKPEISGSQ